MDDLLVLVAAPALGSHPSVGLLPMMKLAFAVLLVVVVAVIVFNLVFPERE